MAEIFDPNQAMPDFDAQTAAATRARAVADFLRKQAAQQTQPQGQMVSGHYVAPHWTQHLSNIMGQLNVGMADRQATDAETQEANAQNQAANQWRSSLPQAVQAQAGTPSFGANEMDQEAVTGSPAVPYQPVPAAARLKATLAGMANPRTAKEALIWNAGMAEEAKREDDQLARRENLLATLAQRAEDAQRRSEDVRASIAQRQEAAREATAARLQMAQMAADARRDAAGIAAAARAGSTTDRGADKLDRQVEKLSSRIEPINPLITAGQALQDLFDKYGDKPIPGFGYAGKLHGTLLSAEGNANRAALKMYTNAIMRAHAGLSQTLAEQHNVNLETLADGNYSEKEIRKVWPLLREKSNEQLKGISAGFPAEVVDIYRKQGGRIDPITSKTSPRRAANASPPPAAAGWKIEEVK